MVCNPGRDPGFWFANCGTWGQTRAATLNGWAGESIGCSAVGKIPGLDDLGICREDVCSIGKEAEGGGSMR